MKLYQHLISLITFSVLILSTPCFGEGLVPTIKNRPLVRIPEKELNYLKIYALGSITFYKHFISPVNGDRCKMEPSCSTFGYQAYKKHGFFWGTLLTFDRLLHEGNEYRVSFIMSHKDSTGNIKLLTYDPVENNDFWLNDEN